MSLHSSKYAPSPHTTEAKPAGPHTGQQGEGEGHAEKGTGSPQPPLCIVGRQSRSSLNPKSLCPTSPQTAGAVSLVPNTGPTQPTLYLDHLSLPASLLSHTDLKMHIRSQCPAQDLWWLLVHLKSRLLITPVRLLAHLVAFALGPPHSQLA